MERGGFPDIEKCVRDQRIGEVGREVRRWTAFVSSTADEWEAWKMSVPPREEVRVIVGWPWSSTIGRWLVLMCS